MKVSCLCPTYARVPTAQRLLEEAIESFLKQDHDDKELLVLNDHPRQHLSCNAPNVHTINVSRRFRSLGEKYNALVGMASGDLICPWEDDDISLPWRISMSAKLLNDFRADYYTPKRYWFYNENRYWYDHPMGVGHSCSMYTRPAFNRVGGYLFISGSQDMEMDQRLVRTVTSHGAVEFGDQALPLTHWFYIMRWQTGSFHLSAPPNSDGPRDLDGFYRSMAGTDAAPGAYILQPMWERDYVTDTRASLP